MARKRNKAQVPVGAWGRVSELREARHRAEAEGHGLELLRGEASLTPQAAESESFRAPAGGADPAVDPAVDPEEKGGLKRRPEGERPRERLLRDGGGALTDAELVGVLLRVGCQGKTAVEMGREILKEHGGLGGLACSDARRLRRPGVGPAKAATVLAGIELARRLVRTRLSQKDPLDDPGAVSSYLLLRFGRLDQEVMGALFVDARNQLLGETEIFRGTMTSSSAEPRTILREAILCGAAGVIVFHTHPGGDPAPSLHDFEFTKRMAKASDVLGVRMLDHLIVGAVGQWVSMRRRRAW
ncbi:MAG: DNA repair protein RadC [Acidobacteriota bacterium]